MFSEFRTLYDANSGKKIALLVESVPNADFAKKFPSITACLSMDVSGTKVYISLNNADIEWLRNALIKAQTAPPPEPTKLLAKEPGLYISPEPLTPEQFARATNGFALWRAGDLDAPIRVSGGPGARTRFYVGDSGTYFDNVQWHLYVHRN